MAYQAWGCSICSTTSSPDAPEGFQIEVHHVKKRSRGGPDSWDNSLGLCGSLLPGRCHQRVEAEEIKLDMAEMRWTDVTAMGMVTGVIRQIPGPPEQGPGERFQLITQLMSGAEKDMLDACVLLTYAKAMEEWRFLEMDGWTAYCRDAGLTRGKVSKMLRVGVFYAGAWKQLPRADQANLSVERLYLCARLAEREGWSTETALSEAVAHPPSELQAMLTGREPDHLFHRCPDCGAEHRIVGGGNG